MKRSSGEGSIQKRKDGRWQAAVMHDRIRHCVYGRTRAEVVEKLKELKQQHERGTDLSKKNLTIEDYLKQWLEDVVKPNKTVSTIRSYEQITNQHLIPKLGHYRLSELNPSHVQRFINGLPKKLAPRTIRNIRNVLRKALNQAIAWRFIDYNAAVPVELPRAGKFTPETLERSAADKFREAIKGHSREALYLTVLVLGLRRGEVLGLRKRDVNLQKRELRIDGQIQWVKGELLRVSTKTEASKRTVPIPDILVEPLTQVLKEQPECDLLFSSRAGTPINPRNLIRQFKELLTAAGLPSTIRLHDLRHTAASNLLGNGLDIKTTADILGHAQTSTTLNTYAHVLKESRAVAVNDAVKRAFGDVVTEEEGH